MSLARIPLTFSVCWAFSKCITPPNPPAAKGECMTTNFVENEWYTQRSPFYTTKLQWIAGIVEIATILAWNFQSSALSQATLRWLVIKGGRPEGLQLTPVITVGGIMVITGTLIRIITYRYLGEFFRFQASIQHDHKLVTGGPYSIVRHPAYTGLLISHLGWFLWQFWEGSWVRESGLLGTAHGKITALSYAVVVILGQLYLALTRISKEDEALRKTFGKRWEDWAKKVPYCAVPGIY